MSARFNVRVELLGGATIQDYEHLHARMTLNGYVTFIVGDDRQVWQLPPAEYVHVSDDPLKVVRNRVSAIVGRGLRPGLSFRLYILQFSDWAAFNLAPNVARKTT